MLLRNQAEPGRRGPARRVGSSACAHERATALYPPGTVVPMANLALMHAMILISAGDIQAGLQQAISTLRTCGCGAASGTVYLARQALATLPEKARTLPAATRSIS